MNKCSAQEVFKELVKEEDDLFDYVKTHWANNVINCHFLEHRGSIYALSFEFNTNHVYVEDGHDLDYDDLRKLYFRNFANSAALASKIKGYCKEYIRTFRVIRERALWQLKDENRFLKERVEFLENKIREFGVVINPEIGY